MYFNANNIIKKRIRFGLSHDANQLNIAYGIDKNFFLGCAVSITSILLANPNLDFSFHIFTNYINDDLELKLEQLADKYNTNITIYLVDDNSLSHLPTTKNWTIATYFRFIVADYFYEKMDKILYLDADITCKGSLQELVTLKFDDNIAYVVTEKDPIWWNKCATRLNEHKLSSGYFNAGFLLIDLKKWKEFSVNSKALELLSDSNLSENFTHLDQDVLNIILLEKVKYLDRKYNQQVSINYELKYKSSVNGYSPILDETILIHYIGPTKPWHKWARDYKCSQYFLDAKSASPWKSTSLLSAITATQWRYCAKHRLHQKKLLSGLICYLKYCLRKIKNPRY
ncbi:UDP-D-galactose:(glucosyl)LPS alpha-1,3-D-galactosyltransferase [Gilliamella bombicola]|uniref:UDP-D-galactose:(Glucosyl)LPS alpha-1,3-D-galactosyltransferase n=1 Tax=Gilliamella bombicola TaxID=1798182 RepID=A0A1C4AS66_9GAMM|nr:MULTISPECIES: glycosyltransferase [Gilliamella]NUF26578.1 lipopolysaccharide 1,3-galactosyltransferase [Gilliamella sp. ESL0254]SCB97381.1 UDP-D-galactose:(glucosyl)LPS alpha-1,3-D-galactosyltransferase [Gilliamella bombicola]